MTHVEDEQFANYIDGELAGSEAVFVERHAESCTECATLLQGWRDFDDLCRDVFPQRVYRVTYHAPVARPWRRALVAAALTLLAAGLCWGAVVAYRAWNEVAPQQPAKAVETAAPEVGQAVEVAPPSESPAAMPDATPAPVPAPAVRYVLSGTVMNAQYEPLEGARVAFTRRIDTLSGPDTQTLRSAVSDAEGHYFLESDIVPYEITVTKAGFRNSVVYRHMVPESEQDMGLDVLLFRAPEANGNVTDAEGEPLAGVTVAAGLIDCYGAGESRVQTDAEGGFSILGSGFDYKPALHFIKEGFSALSLEQERPDDWSVALPRVPPVEVRVQREGKSVPAALAVMKLRDYSESYVPVHRETTNGVGVAIFSSLLARHSYDLTVLDPQDKWPPVREEAILVRPEPGQIVEVEIKRTYEGRVEGRVVFEDGQPVASAAVGTPDRRRYETDSTGRVSVPMIAGEQPQLAYWEGVQGFEPVGDWSRSFQAVALRKPFETTFVLKRRHLNLRAISFEGDDGAIPAELILADNGLYPSADHGRWCWRASSQTGSYWTYGRWMLAIDPAQHRAAAALLGDTPVKRLDLNIPTDTMEGYARDSTGAGVPFLELELRMESLWVPPILTQTDETGRFIIHDLPKRGAYRVSVPYAITYQFAETQTLHDWKTGVPVEIVTAATVPTGVQGLALFDDGSPAGAAIIEEESGGHLAAADVGGRFVVYPGADGFMIRGRISDSSVSDAVFVTKDTKGLRLVLPNAEDLAVAQERVLHENEFKQMGVVFKMFANEHSGKEYPLLSAEQGVFNPTFSDIYPEYLVDPDMVRMLEGRHLSHVCYLGYAVQDEQTAMQMLDAYERYGAEGIRGQDLEVAPGAGTLDTGTIYSLREDVTEFLDPTVQSELPVLWEIPGTRESGGGWVLYMDGHVEWQEYPGEFPMTEAFIERLRRLQRPPESSILPE